jgi:hypothetical protein
MVEHTHGRIANKIVVDGQGFQRISVHYYHFAVVARGKYDDPDTPTTEWHVVAWSKDWSYCYQKTLDLAGVYAERKIVSVLDHAGV